MTRFMKSLLNIKEIENDVIPWLIMIEMDYQKLLLLFDLIKHIYEQFDLYSSKEYNVCVIIILIYLL